MPTVLSRSTLLNNFLITYKVSMCTFLIYCLKQMDELCKNSVVYVKSFLHETLPKQNITIFKEFIMAPTMQNYINYTF